MSTNRFAATGVILGLTSPNVPTPNYGVITTYFGVGYFVLVVTAPFLEYVWRNEALNIRHHVRFPTAAPNMGFARASMQASL